MNGREISRSSSERLIDPRLIVVRSWWGSGGGGGGLLGGGGLEIVGGRDCWGWEVAGKRDLPGDGGLLGVEGEEQGRL